MNNHIYGRAAVEDDRRAPLRVTARVGIFFDGTGNNRVNTRIGADCRAAMQAGERHHTAACAGRHEKSSSSYSNDLTNIARLAELYRQSPRAVLENNEWRVYYAVYIGGVGTKSGGRDALWSGQSFGRGTTGVLAKVEVAMKKLNAALASFAVHNPGCVIQALELDLFGFSRGAASARHLVNEVLKRERGVLQALLHDGQIAWAEEVGWARGSIQVMVVGLFDTVAAIGSWRDLGNVRDASNRRVNLYLPAGCARQVLHLVARDEQRRNFALNSIQPGWSREIVLPGAHSDIGGGYLPCMVEDVLLTRPRTAVVDCRAPLEHSSLWQQAQADLEALDGQRWIDPADPSASLQVQCSKVASRGCDTSLGKQLVMASVCLRREVLGHLSRVHLRVMHALACDEGVPFEAITDRAELALPDELQGVAQRLIAQARGDEMALSTAEELLLSRRYIHHSAHWRPVIGTLGGLGDALFVHAPQTGGRVIHPNVAQPGYPH